MMAPYLNVLLRDGSYEGLAFYVWLLGILSLCAIPVETAATSTNPTIIDGQEINEGKALTSSTPFLSSTPRPTPALTTFLEFGGEFGLILVAIFILLGIGIAAAVSALFWRQCHGIKCQPATPKKSPRIFRQASGNSDKERQLHLYQRIGLTPPPCSPQVDPPADHFYPDLPTTCDISMIRESSDGRTIIDTRTAVPTTTSSASKSTVETGSTADGRSTSDTSFLSSIPATDHQPPMNTSIITISAPDGNVSTAELLSTTVIVE